MHITITGRLGSGKSTVAKLLRDRYGFEIYSTGTIQRAMAAELGLSTLEMNEMMKGRADLDHKIDDAVVKISEDRRDDRLIFDSRMAWHFAKHSFRVFVTIDPQVAGNRVFNDQRGAVEHYDSPEEARDGLLERSRVENLRFKDIYHVDNLDYHNYDLIVDSSVADQNMVCELIYREFTAFEADPEHYEKKMFLAAKSIYPAALPENVLKTEGTYVPVFTVGGFHFAAEGYDRVLEAIRTGEAFFPVTYTDAPPSSAETLKRIGVSGLQVYEEKGGFRYASVPAVYL